VVWQRGADRLSGAHHESAARDLEGLPAAFTRSSITRRTCQGPCRGALRISRTDAVGHAAVAARDGNAPWPTPTARWARRWASCTCSAIFRRGKSARRGDGAQSAGRLRRAHRPACVDGSRDTGEGESEAGRAQGRPSAIHDKWRTISGLKVLRGDAFATRSARAVRLSAQSRETRSAVDRSEWVMNPQLVNAVNLPALNALNFPAAILQPPYFDPERDAAMTTARPAPPSDMRSAIVSMTRERCSTPAGG